MWGNGLVALLAECHELISIRNFSEPQRVALAALELSEAPTSIAVIPPQASHTHNIQVLDIIFVCMLVFKRLFFFFPGAGGNSNWYCPRC